MPDRDTARLVDAYDARTTGRIPHRPRDNRPRLVCPKCRTSLLLDPPGAALYTTRTCPTCGADMAVVIP